MIINIKKYLQEYAGQDIILIVTITFKDINTFKKQVVESDVK